MKTVSSKPLLFGSVAVGLLFGFSGCGSPDSSVEGLTNVNGNAIFGSQCPYGTLSRPFAAPLYLWDCPLGLKTIDLGQPLRPIVLQADCKKKLIMARTLDGVLDTSWEVLPDGSFSFTIDGGNALIRDDGKGNHDCTVPLAAELSGKLDCTDRDRVKITVESVWWLDKQAPNAPRPSSTPTNPPNPTPTTTSPTATPTIRPTITPTGTPTWTPTPTFSPTFTPTVTPTHTSEPLPTVTVTPRPTHSILDTLLLSTAPGAGASPKCGVPKGCYFFASTSIQQCE